MQNSNYERKSLFVELLEGKPELMDDKHVKPIDKVLWIVLL